MRINLAIAKRLLLTTYEVKEANAFILTLDIIQNDEMISKDEIEEINANFGKKG